MGEFSILDLGIVPPCGRADMVDLKRNISPYCPPSHVHVIICDRIYEKGDNLRIINTEIRHCYKTGSNFENLTNDKVGI